MDKGDSVDTGGATGREKPAREVPTLVAAEGPDPASVSTVVSHKFIEQILSDLNGNSLAAMLWLGVRSARDPFAQVDAAELSDALAITDTAASQTLLALMRKGYLGVLGGAVVLPTNIFTGEKW